MKKESKKIKIIKEKTNKNNYTFLDNDDDNSLSAQSQRENLDNAKIEKSKEKAEKYKEIK